MYNIGMICRSLFTIIATVIWFLQYSYSFVRVFFASSCASVLGCCLRFRLLLSFPSFFWRVSLWPLRILLTSYQLGSWQKHCHNLCIHFFADISPSLPPSFSFIFDCVFLLCCGLHFRNFSSSFAPTPTPTPKPTSTPTPTLNVLRPSQLWLQFASVISAAIWQIKVRVESAPKQKLVSWPSMATCNMGQLRLRFRLRLQLHLKQFGNALEKRKTIQSCLWDCFPWVFLSFAHFICCRRCRRLVA